MDVEWQFLLIYILCNGFCFIYIENDWKIL